MSTHLRNLISVLFLLLSSCAGMDFHPVRDAAADQKARGYRYFEQAPFLFVKSDGSGGVSGEVIYLNTPTMMSARPYAYGAAIDVTMDFSNGALSDSSATGDETVIPIAVADALAKVVAAAFDAPAQTEAKVPVPQVYRIWFEKDAVVLKGGPTLGADGNPAVIRVRLVPAAATGGK